MRIKVKPSNRGFSLIELSIGLLILGLFLVPIITIYNNELRQRQISDTRGAFTDIRNTINTFATVNGRYPVPAAFNTREGDADYGIEGNPNPQPCTSANWFTNDGMCRVPGANVLIGAVPFDALGLTPESAHDFWNRKILYAVTTSQTDASTYVKGNGSVLVRGLDATGAPVAITTPDDTRDMVLISHGESGRGAYSRAGVLVDPCIGGSAELEDENCNMDEFFLLDENPDLNLGSRSDVVGANFYDDLTEAQDRIPIDIWYQSPVSNTFAISSATRIGVGTTEPDSKLHVIGNIQADQNIISNAICGAGGANCFNPVIIAGDELEMDCNQGNLPEADEAVLSIGNSQVYCASTVDSGGNPIDGEEFRLPSDFGTINCSDTGELMTGIDASGDPICAAPP